MKIINVVSGKGGTGKTLVVSVLAELLSKRAGAKVLVIDVDIFVRGLTTLLFYEQRGQLNIANDKAVVSVSDALTQNSTKLGDTLIVHCRNFDVWPAVTMVDELLDWTQLTPTSVEIAKIRLENLVSRIPHTYDFVFLDSRAGFDGLVAATYQISDVILNVGDDDKVGSMTSSTLIRELQRITSTRANRIYYIVNKCLGSGRHVEPERQYVVLGQIPFDADIMASYGSDQFWSGITRSLIEPALVGAWNTLCRLENWGEEEKSFALSSRRQSAFPSAAIDRRLGQLTSTQRFMAVYGFLFLLGGGFVSLGGVDLVRYLWHQPMQLSGAAIAALGAALLLSVFAKFLTRGGSGISQTDKTDPTPPL